MPDAIVYYFLVRDRATGRLVSSKRRATLAAIKNQGEPLLESAMVVDESEVDAMGFLARGSAGREDPVNELWGEIRSLRLRSDSREREAKELDDANEGRKLILCEESRELRNRADRLQQLILRRSEGVSGAAFQPAASAGGAVHGQFFKPE